MQVTALRVQVCKGHRLSVRWFEPNGCHHVKLQVRLQGARPGAARQLLGRQQTALLCPRQQHLRLRFSDTLVTAAVTCLTLVMLAR